MQSSPLVGLIAYGAGNLRSVANALESLSCRVLTAQRAEDLDRCDKVVFPGVGEARSAMEHLLSRKFEDWILGSTKPFLGICLGMQVLFERSTERNTPCLGILSGTVDRIRHVKVPHMGWNTLTRVGDNPLFDGVPDDAYFYFAHSYAAPVVAGTIASTEYGAPFSAAIHADRRWGVQFHPEKSGNAGLRVLRNFIERC